MRKFEIPEYYKSSFTGKIKEARKIDDPRKKDFSPAKLDFGPIKFYIARHFGFCFGVENAIEIAYKAIEENPGKRIFLLSQMIHNPEVNHDLQRKGIRFIMDTYGNMLMNWNELTPDDIVIIPAFGTTLEIENMLNEKGIETKNYDTTCPFVEKVWKTSYQLGKKNYTIIIHGKSYHEETKATFSHSKQDAPSVIVKDINEARLIGDIILNKRPKEDFYKLFEGKYSEGFDVDKDLEAVGVVNQTTMLASETQEISDYFKEVMEAKYPDAENVKGHFANTKDTLCYATNDNQNATYRLLDTNADMALVVGGYNSSNTSHIVEMCENYFPTYFIRNADEIVSANAIRHYDFRNKEVLTTNNFLPAKRPLEVVLTSGASCPDTAVDAVMDKILSYFEDVRSKEAVLEEYGIQMRGAKA